MQSSVRAVESYRRSRLVDSATLDEDKVTPVYRLDEICELIRSSPADIVKELAEFIFNRLEHKSPIVKQKTLRLIKYSAGKCGSEFRREMQRQSGTIRNLFHYKGQPDPLKGDAFNKAVRDTAHEAVTAIFASNEKTSSMEDVTKRIQGFGNTNFDAFSEGKEKKTMLGEVMSFGSASIKQGLSVITNHYRGSSTGSSSYSPGSYQAPNLRRSISGRDNFDSNRDSFSESRSLYEYNDHNAGQHSVDYHSADVDDTRAAVHDFSNSVSESVQPKQAQSLVDQVAALGGVRLQPSRDSVQAFLLEARKLDPMFLHQALEGKLQSHSWQVRFKVLCLLEAIICEKNIEKFVIVASLFEDNSSAVSNCLEFPHATLKDKAKKVLSMLGTGSKEEKEQVEGLELKEEAVPSASVKLPDLTDLMDTTESQFEKIQDLSYKLHADLFDHEQNAFVPEVVHNTLGNDPFAGMSLHTPQHANGSSIQRDLFSGLSLEDDKVLENQSLAPSKSDESSLFEGLCVSTNDVKPKDDPGSLVDLMDSLTTKTHVPVQYQHQTVPEKVHYPFSMASSAQHSIPPFPLFNAEGGFANATLRPPGPPFVSPVPSVVSSGERMSPLMYVNSSIPMPTGIVGVPPSNIYMQHAFAQHNFGVPLTGAAFNQHQVMAGLPTIPRPGMVSRQQSGSKGLQGHHGFGSGYDATFTDGFDFTDNSAPRYTMGYSKKEETKAFDFISDHISAVRGIKK